MKTIRHEFMPGHHISIACEEAVKLARQDSCNVEFDFNDITLTATPDTNPETLASSYSQECKRRHEAYLASPEYKEACKRADEREREKKEKAAAALVGAPEEMTLLGAEGWRKAREANSDGYGGAVMSYADRWARMMEARMARGEQLSEIADECSHIADLEGITGFQYGCAVSTLASVWIHGEALRQWHNLKTQLRDEGERANKNGGVLNPAVISLG